MAPESIAHYRISSTLGKGAMGEVYRATDSKLGREVAIKLIPEDFAFDTMRMARFTREAQVLASLNYLNIAAIYGVEDRALIMADVASGAAFQTSPPKTLFQLPLELLSNQNPGTMADATRDGQRLLLVMPVQENSQRELAVVLNSQDSLKR